MVYHTKAMMAKLDDDLQAAGIPLKSLAHELQLKLEARY
jgi:hypothetical protein